ncbi:MAG: TraB/GumN family protein, partial [Steroidobacteraceae bacterium]
MRTQALNFLLAALLLTGPAHATEGPRLWRLQGANNAVYLFGSMHLLRPGDFRVEGALASAYQDAETLLLEVDPNGLTPASAESIILQRALDEKGRAEPWFEALNVTTTSLNQVGFTVESGVEAQLQRLARADGKRLGGLETLDEQLATLDSLSPEVQQELLQK